MPHDSTLETAQPSEHLQRGTIFKKNFPSDFRWVRRIVQQAISALESNGMSLEQLGSVEIVLAEALNNIAEHAYPEDAPGDVSLSIRRRQTGLLIEVRDKGAPMPDGRAPIGHHPLADPDDAIPEGGYGWFLIRELVRDLIYDRREGENFLIFRMAFP